jgi:hypothetical protein
MLTIQYRVTGDDWRGWRIVEIASGRVVRLGYRNRGTATLVADLMTAGRIAPVSEEE